MGRLPQGSVEDNGEGQKRHGGSAAHLGNSCEGLHGDLVQDWPLWATPPTRTPSVGGQAHLPAKTLAPARKALPGTGVWAPPEQLGSGWVGCYQQQGKEGQVVTAADSALDSELC